MYLRSKPGKEKIVERNFPDCKVKFTNNVCSNFVRRHPAVRLKSVNGVSAQLEALHLQHLPTGTLLSPPNQSHGELVVGPIAAFLDAPAASTQTSLFLCPLGPLLVPD
jgi:hypothetical protein